MSKSPQKENPEKSYSSRLRSEELKAAIFNPQGTVNGDPLKDELEEEYSVFYTLNGTKNAKKSKDGNFLMEEDSELVYAKKTVYGRRSKYFVKINRYGHCYNPLGMYEKDKATKNPKIGGRDFQFREVSDKVFEFYLEFLRTKNNGHLLNAQRSMF